MIRVLSLLALAGALAAQDPETERAVEFGVVPGALRYEVARFDVHVGDRVALRFTNNGLMPHNLLVVRPERTDAVVAAAMALGAEGLAKDYVPESDDVLAHAPILQPDEGAWIRFAAPDGPQVLGYVCTFPGHGTVMRGSIRVLPRDAALEPPVRDPAAGTGDAPPAEDRLANSGATAFPLGSREEPLVMRTFVPDPGLSDEVLAHHGRGLPAPVYDVQVGRDKAGAVPPIDGIPAAIAVNFGGDLSYVWDTTECRLLYAWTGGFLDMTKYWGVGAGGGRTSFGYVPEINGTLTFVASGPHPLGAEEAPVYRGWAMVDGAPEFRYTKGVTEVRERIVPGDQPLEIVLEYAAELSPDFAGFGHGTLLSLTFAEELVGRLAGDALEDGRWVILTVEEPTTVRLTLQGVERSAPPDPFADVERAGLVSVAARLENGEIVERVIDVVALKPTAPMFLDRDYAFADVPEILLGADLVRTRNDDKEAGGQAVSWAVDLAEPGTLWILLDERVAPPAWLVAGMIPFRRTDLLLSTTGNWTYRAWRAEVGAGTHELGAQQGGSFYAIAATRRTP